MKFALLLAHLDESAIRKDDNFHNHFYSAYAANTTKCIVALKSVEIRKVELSDCIQRYQHTSVNERP